MRLGKARRYEPTHDREEICCWVLEMQAAYLSSFWIFEFPKFKLVWDAYEVEIQRKPSSFHRTERQVHTHIHAHMS